MKILALCAFRDAAQYLPEFVGHLRAHVDGILMINDGSVDSGEVLVSGDPLVKLGTQLFSGHPQHLHEIKNRKSLLLWALREGADYVLCLDADERCEFEFLKSMRELACWKLSYSLHVRDLWNSEDQYRTDGVWSAKRKEVFFPIYPYWGVEELHCPWRFVDCPAPTTPTRFHLYHLGSLTPELRKARVDKFHAIDPNHVWQSDYNYLADETGLQLEKIPKDRGWNSTTAPPKT
jgi:hypothetical protein